jgi:glycosyltransferase involved in cell wall biosynthesis
MNYCLSMTEVQMKPGRRFKKMAASTRPSSQTVSIKCRGIRLDHRRGQQSALLAGMVEMRRRTLITMDDDLSHPVESIRELMKVLSAGADLAYAEPSRRPGNLFRRIASRMHQLHMSYLTGSSPKIRVGSFRAMSAGMVDRILDAPMPFPYLSAQALILNPKPQVVTVETPEWKTGSPGRFSFKALIRLEFNLARHYSPAVRRIRKILRQTQQADRLQRTEAVVSEWIAERTNR